jgi:hypothetical protein
MLKGIERIEPFRGETDRNYLAERLAEVMEDTKAIGPPLLSG